MRSLGVTLGVLCVLLAGCGGTSEPAAETPQQLTERELVWIRGYSRWAVEFWDEGFKARQGVGVHEVCAQKLDEAGRPPTPRLQSAAADARDVCEYLGSGDKDAAEWAAGTADDSLLPLLLENQRLEVRSGAASSRSHVDLDLGAIAAAISEQNVEVRCWSAAHWRRYVGEANAWTDGDDDFLDLLGRADVDGGRMHLRLEDCNLLVSVGHEDVERRSREGLVAAADAVMTFAHETGHFVDPDGAEAEVECLSYERVDRVGAELGLEPAEVKLLVDAYREVIAPTLPNEYRDPACEPAR